MVKFLNTTPFPSRTFGGGYKYLQTKHRKWIFSATIPLTRKKFIFPGRYLKVNHFEKKLDMGGGPFKNAKGWGGVKKYEY